MPSASTRNQLTEFTLQSLSWLVKSSGRWPSISLAASPRDHMELFGLARHSDQEILEIRFTLFQCLSILFFLINTQVFAILLLWLDRRKENSNCWSFYTDEDVRGFQLSPLYQYSLFRLGLFLFFVTCIVRCCLQLWLKFQICYSNIHDWRPRRRLCAVLDAF